MSGFPYRTIFNSSNVLVFQNKVCYIQNMQTFLPYYNFTTSATCLDYRRLGKQRVEAMQLYNILVGKAKSKAWSHHPAALMWKGSENALAHYFNCIRHEWIRRGYCNNMPELIIQGEISMPSWLGNEDFHKSHRSNLMRKFPEHYSQFKWNVPNNLPYIWPI